MNDDTAGLRVPLFIEREEPENYELYIYGTLDAAKRKKDTFGKALRRYACDSGLTGISRFCYYYYCNDLRKIGY